MDRQGPIELRNGVRESYPDVLGEAALDAIRAVSVHEGERRRLMADRMARRARRAREREPIGFLPATGTIPRTTLPVAAARSGDFQGAEIPAALERQWIQGTGPAARPRARVEDSLRNVAYALLSGADGWMFDGEDALGQVDRMSLDNQRCMKLAYAREPVFMNVARQVADEMNGWSAGFLGRKIIDDWEQQLRFTTRIFRPRGLHLDDRHLRLAGHPGLGASLVDAALYVANNQAALVGAGAPIVLYLPKIQTAEEASLWADVLDTLEDHRGLARGSIKVYVLVEQVEACFQLMEIRAVLGRHFVGFNTGRWDYINSVSDAMAGDPDFVNPNIDAISMTYGYMRIYEDRVRRAVNTPDRDGRHALWQGGMEPNIPVGTPAAVEAAMKRAVSGAGREESAGASGKWVAHWKMVHIVRPVWEKEGRANQTHRTFPPLTYTKDDEAALFRLEPAARTIRGARDLLSVALQYGNAFGRGFQAAALKAADFFGDADVLYLMEDMATGEIRLSILWEWLNKGARLDDGVPFTRELFDRLLSEEYEKLLRASDKDVHDDSKGTTLPIAREIVVTYVTNSSKPPWYVDLLNLNLDNADLEEARRRIARYVAAFEADGTRITHNLDFESSP